MSEPIILIRAKGHKTAREMFVARKIFMEQAEQGLILIPHDFEYAVINPDALKCEIKIVEMPKKAGWFDFLYAKWVKRNCRHFCLFCKYRKTEFEHCYSEMTRKETENE